jgi:arabinofuranosyltransferase
MDFSVSGMENPLTDFTVALFLLTFWHRPRVLALSFIAALSAVNRMDTALFFLPALSLVYWRAGWRAWNDILLDWSPFLAWCAFSVFYYGFLFPNTAYAKLYTGIPATATWHQGLLYYLNAVRSDTVTVLAIGAGLAIAFRHREYLIASGVLAYLLYVVGVGGDFMSSRFFTAPLVMATMLILRFWKPGPWSAAAALAAVVIGGLSVSTPTLLSTGKNFTVANPVDLSGIANERAAYNPWTGLQNYRSDPLWPDHPSSKAGHEAKLQRRKASPTYILECSAIKPVRVLTSSTNSVSAMPF